jgi:hypothetical protein
MIDWEKRSVEDFLKVSATLAPARPAELLFRFAVRSLAAELRVQPVAGEVALSLRAASGEEIASWFIACARIELREDHDDRPYLLLEAPVIENRLRSWIAIGCENDDFHVFTSAVVLPEK